MDFQWHDIESDPKSWDQRVSEASPCLFNLSPMLAVHAFGGARRVGILITRAGILEGVLGGLERRDGQGKSFESLCFPTLHGEGSDALVQRLIRWLRDQGYTRVKFGSFSGGVEGYPLDQAKVQLTQRLEFPWDLSAGEQERRKRLRSNHRRKLTKLDKRQFQVQRISRHPALTLTWLRVKWEQRKGGELGLRKIWNMYSYHRLLHRNLAGAELAHLYGLYDENGTLLSAAYMLEYEGLSFYMIGASSPAGYSVGASTKLFWELARGYSERGFRYLHLGGVPEGARDAEHEEHGVYRFKHGFGITPAPRLTLSINT